MLSSILSSSCSLLPSKPPWRQAMEEDRSLAQPLLEEWKEAEEEAVEEDYQTTCCHHARQLSSSSSSSSSSPPPHAHHTASSPHHPCPWTTRFFRSSPPSPAPPSPHARTLPLSGMDELMASIDSHTGIVAYFPVLLPARAIQEWLADALSYYPTLTAQLAAGDHRSLVVHGKGGRVIFQEQHLTLPCECHTSRGVKKVAAAAGGSGMCHHLLLPSHE